MPELPIAATEAASAKCKLKDCSRLWQSIERQKNRTNWCKGVFPPAAKGRYRQNLPKPPESTVACVWGNRGLSFFNPLLTDKGRQTIDWHRSSSGSIRIRHLQPVHESPR